MSDLISRQWLMECIDEGWIRFDTEKDANTYIHLVRDIAPSAQPERKTGKWIKNYSVIQCSECRRSSWSLSFEDLVRSFNYCPNCGARMFKDGEEHETD